MLICIGFGIPNVQLTWTHYGQIVSNSPTTFVIQDAFFQAGRAFQQSFLHICGPDVTQSGPYTCTVNNGQVTLNASTQLTVRSEFFFTFFYRINSFVLFHGITAAGYIQLVAISDHVTLSEGETTILTCLGYGQPDVELMWTFNDENITNSSVVTVYEDQEGRFIKQLFLEICSVRAADSGIYTCTISNNEASVSAMTQLTVSGKHQVVEYS